MTTIKSIAQNCLFARFAVSPIPKSLQQSLAIYTHLNSLGPLVQYNQAICPVTKKRLGAIKAIFHDIDRQQDPDTHKIFLERYPSGDLVREREILFNSMELLSDLERKIFQNLVVEIDKQDFQLSILEMSRNYDKVMHGSIYANAKYMKVAPMKSTPLNEMEELLQRKRDTILKGFRGLW